jgi:putative nucleotidyltransferase with HDIG domain
MLCPIRLRLFLRALLSSPESDATSYLVSLLRLQHEDLALHSLRVADLADRLAIALGWSDAARRDLALGALLHDVGKMLLPRELLLAGRRLLPDERREVERHALLGVQLLADALLPAATLDAVAHHHERWDGAGYPLRLAAERIPLSARLVAIADVYDTMTNPRPYAPTLSPAEALDELRAASGSQFDPTLLQSSIAALEPLDLPLGAVASDTFVTGSRDLGRTAP